MHFAISALLVLASALAVTSGHAVQVRYDTKYGDPTWSTLATACSDGKNGLATKGYPTLGSLKNFPNVGASSTIAGYNSKRCGECYKLYYGGKEIYVTAVDHSATGFVLSLAAMDELTGGLAVELGAITAGCVLAAPERCKM